MESTRDKISRLRESLGWSVHRLAKESGVPKSTIHDYLQGRTDLGTERADRLIIALEKNSEKSDE